MYKFLLKDNIKNNSSYNIMVMHVKEGVNMSIEIGKMIEKERKSKNISKVKLAEMIGCTARAIDYWENGTRNISLENADKIFKALETTLTIGAVKEHEQQVIKIGKKEKNNES